MCLARGRRVPFLQLVQSSPSISSIFDEKPHDCPDDPHTGRKPRVRDRMSVRNSPRRLPFNLRYYQGRFQSMSADGMSFLARRKAKLPFLRPVECKWTLVGRAEIQRRKFRPYEPAIRPHPCTMFSGILLREDIDRILRSYPDPLLERRSKIDTSRMRCEFLPFDHVDGLWGRPRDPIDPSLSMGRGDFGHRIFGGNAVGTSHDSPSNLSGKWTRKSSRQKSVEGNLCD